MKLIHESLLSFNVKCRESEPVSRGTDRSDMQLRLRIGGVDRRKVRFKGWVTVESFVYGDAEGSFVVMQRDEVTISIRTGVMTSNWHQILGFTAVLATVVEGTNQAQRCQPARFEEIGIDPCTSHLIPTHIFTIPIHRVCLL